MRILDYMERLQTLTRLLKKEHTGSAAKIAKEMGVHRNTIINYFLELRAFTTHAVSGGASAME